MTDEPTSVPDALTGYHRKLIDGGIPEDTAREIVIDAARLLHEGHLPTGAVA
jgi:hypothetical protein